MLTYVSNFNLMNPHDERQTEVLRLINALQIPREYLVDGKDDAPLDLVTPFENFHLELAGASRRQSLFQFFYRINPDTLDQQLRIILDQLGIGYCYLIRRNGKHLNSHASGWAQIPGDGDIKWGLGVKQNIGSVSKFITAIAIIQLLQDIGVSVNDPIAKYLPDYWTKGPGVDSITFANLLRHEAGLGATLSGAGAGDFAAAKSEIAKGPTAIPQQYKNVNYALLRVLFATLTNTIPASFRAPKVNLPYATGLTDDKMWNAFSSAVYIQRVNEKVFAPAGVSARDLNLDPSSSKAYPTPPAGVGWQWSSTNGDGAGPGLWQLSVTELIQVLEAFRSGSLMAHWRANNILSNLYGLDYFFSTNAGPVFRKFGRAGIGWDGLKVKGMDSAIYLMPGNLNLAISVNSVPPAHIVDLGAGAVIKNDPDTHLERVQEAIEKSVEFIF